MRLLALALLCALLSGPCSGEDPEAENKTTPAPVPPTLRATEMPGSGATSPLPHPGSTRPSGAPAAVGTTAKELSTASQLTARPSVSPAVSGTGAATSGVTKASPTPQHSPAATSLPLSNAVSTSQSVQAKTENQSSLATTGKTASTLQPGAPTASTPPGTAATALDTSSQPAVGGTENPSNASSSSANPSYSSVVLPVVIALIVMTLSVFALVGLYRVCRRRDPGPPDSGNDQPPSEKESVKLLTVKTISHESGLAFGC
ncbi:endomucin isoform X2 [Talpa occidentalis]|uniref:endomucin isoform X2 n=1 Tax=Talpa occidentalis TaxID=50954 RepID=UPI0018905080|nr:endomucin isoform X2 [Talpa occidentalis]